ncbi:MAG: DUF433 domain-containing protein [Candidatus Poribacteria bacterium]|nr:DUF433 domain-containing protein [Candidatus Poribacteria bacterium]
MVRIVANPGILGGKPIVEGTRLSVEHILGLLANGMSNQEIIADYPDLTEESIRAVLGYAARALRNDIVVDAVVSHRDGTP